MKQSIHGRLTKNESWLWIIPGMSMLPPGIVYGPYRTVFVVAANVAWANVRATTAAATTAAARTARLPTIPNRLSVPFILRPPLWLLCYAAGGNTLLATPTAD